MKDFETCQIDPHRFNHRNPMTAEMVYLESFSEEVTTQKIRDGLISLLKHHGIPEEKIRGL